MGDEVVMRREASERLSMLLLRPRDHHENIICCSHAPVIAQVDVCSSIPMLPRIFISGISVLPSHSHIIRKVIFFVAVNYLLSSGDMRRYGKKKNCLAVILGK